MGNSSGKMVGFVTAAVVVQVVPGIGQIAGALLLAGAVTAGSTVDAVVDHRKQRADNERAADAMRRTQEDAINAERDRIQQEKDAEAKILRVQQEQVGLVDKILTACRTGEVDQIPDYLEKLDDHYFYKVLGQQPISESKNPDVRESVQEMLTTEEQRRDPSLVVSAGLKPGV